MWHTALKKMMIAVASEKLDTETGSAQVFVQLGHSSTVTSVAFSPDGKYVLSGSLDETLKLWDIETGREIRTFTSSSTSLMSE